MPDRMNDRERLNDITQRTRLDDADPASTKRRKWSHIKTGSVLILVRFHLLLVNLLRSFEGMMTADSEQ